MERRDVTWRELGMAAGLAGLVLLGLSVAAGAETSVFLSVVLLCGGVVAVSRP